MKDFLELGGHSFKHGQNDVDLVLAEAEDHEEGLEGDFDDRFTDEGRTEEHAEGDQEVTTQETCQVE